MIHASWKMQEDKKDLYKNKNKKDKIRRHTRRLNPVTVVIEVAMVALESASAPRCPTIITDTTCRRYCNTDTATIGAAM